ncbi:multiheme c-type cytochrome [Thermocrinis sp.]
MILLFLLFFLFSCAKFEEIVREEDLLQRPEAKRCSDCHREIFEEWKNSRHAKAWVSEHFKLESENYTKNKCLSCHAPHQVDPDKEPILRVEFKEDGVGCVACHFKEETKAMHGPLKVWSPPHPSKEDLSYIKSNFCAGCHQETFKQWQMVKTEKSCQDCHMPSLGKKDLIQKFPFHLFHLAKPRHSHEFPALRAKPEDLKLEIKENKLYITNVGVPHNLPTADQGDPKLYITVIFDTPEGQQTIRKLLSAQAKTALEYGKPLELDLPEKSEGIRVVIHRKLSHQEERELILDKTLR